MHILKATIIGVHQNAPSYFIDINLTNLPFFTIEFSKEFLEFLLSTQMREI